MAFQPSVAEYFNSRKRPATVDLKTHDQTKVLVLDESSKLVCSENTLPQISSTNVPPQAKKIVYSNNSGVSKVIKNNKLKFKNLNVLPKVKKVKADGSQPDIRETLSRVASNNIEKKVISEEPTISAQDESEVASKSEPNVTFLKRGLLSPAKAKSSSKIFSHEEATSTETQKETQSLSNESKDSGKGLKKETGLGHLKAMMSRSSRLAEIKNAVQQFKEKSKAFTESLSKDSDSLKPKLDGFEKIDIDVPASPLKTPKKVGHLISPKGKFTPSSLFASPPSPLHQSPLKSPLKSPAFQRYQALVTEGKPALVLPFKYRAVAELFRCVDQVAAIIHNRKETITLAKLKPGVQEISRKNLTEYHLGQIKTLYPDAFDFTIEKRHTHGSGDKYDLVITPKFNDTKEVTDANKNMAMGPSVILARRRFLYNALLELTKTHHEDFLLSLDPPMRIPRARLTRWHPEFAVDDVPDIISAALPQPPNVERVTTAKDVLERARNLFVLNPRMEKALQRLSDNQNTGTASPTPASAQPVETKPALHGVPASLLEKVRAKQAARALEAMTRTAGQAQEAVRLTRLPEMARIVRNLFVAEKKGVLARDLVLRKLSDSYRESLNLDELHDHLNLLAEKTPGWLTFCNLRKTDYVRLSRGADMSRVMARLESLAVEHCI